MKKNYLFVSTIVIAVALTVLLLIDQNSRHAIQFSTNSMVGGSQAATTSESNEVALAVPTDIFKDQLVSYSSKHPRFFTDPITNSTVSFQGVIVEARNPGSNLYLDGK